jgi:hypothetical protein
MPYEKSAKNKQILIKARGGNPKNGRPSTILYQARPKKGTKGTKRFSLLFCAFVPFCG